MEINLNVANYQNSGNSSQVRCVSLGGYIAPADINVIEYITIATNNKDYKDCVN